MQKAKILYFTVFILAVFAFVFHVTAMGHHHWKTAVKHNFTNINYINQTTIGLFTRCVTSYFNATETCFPNKFPMNNNFLDSNLCVQIPLNDNFQCDFLPSTKGIASCAIIAAVFLGLAIVILFIHSINTSEARSVGICLSFFPLLLLLLTFIFILITLILVGSYLSRDMMYILRRPSTDSNLQQLLEEVRQIYTVRIGWSTGLDIIALVLTFFSFILYTVFVFKVGRSS
ncbi:unnamed protein product [Rotaria socialis]|uniref:Uncharacterized protein n=1 Tax=Rotaria socialis TaxID=392032 RepID=A0A819YBS6_9BILA|nr:unnamed protein product [Rotaria socialis]CAF3305400.1 unnamed protein product [Rotaria socialis]CAF3402133.1 unnamed protein product [Rotaria socialis]CAF3409666.1 unnamed protein product [Rotaria socialis]CAF4133974.1 unnamed protein product [Rotaria socialis]